MACWQEGLQSRGGGGEGGGIGGVTGEGIEEG